MLFSQPVCKRLISVHAGYACWVVLVRLDRAGLVLGAAANPPSAVVAVQQPGPSLLTFPSFLFYLQVPVPDRWCTMLYAAHQTALGGGSLETAFGYEESYLHTLIERSQEKAPSVAFSLRMHLELVHMLDRIIQYTQCSEYIYTLVRHCTLLSLGLPAPCPAPAWLPAPVELGPGCTPA